MLNTLENNKLIAEFLGRNGKINKSLYSWKGIDALLSGGWVPIEQTKFHSDWNWLMQVVEKIRKFHNGTEPLNDKQIGQLLQLIKKLNESLTLRNELSIEAVYNACVEFIKWYNEQK